MDDHVLVCIPILEKSRFIPFIEPTTPTNVIRNRKNTYQETKKVEYLYERLHAW